MARGREIELSALDVRYEGYRMRQPRLEERLLPSIMERGIEEPLEGVDTAEGSILLNGFKRYRCARKLKIERVLYVSLGEDEAAGVLALLRLSNNRALGILEQAMFIDDLKKRHRMTVAEIAHDLSRSKSWVSMRAGLMGEMTGRIRDKLFSGAFPVYSYMYTLRQFMRMNAVPKKDIEAFVTAVSGKGLSVREIGYLARGCFHGPEALRSEILSGNVTLPLERMRRVPDDTEGCTDFERSFLRDLEVAGKYLQRVMGKCGDPRLKGRPFMAQANLLTAGILSKAPAFYATVRQFHDRSGQA